MPCELYVDDFSGGIDLGVGSTAARLVRRKQSGREVLDEASLKRTSEDGFFGVEEERSSLFYQQVNRLGAQVAHPFVGITDGIGYVLDLTELFVGEEALDKSLCFVVAEDVELACILDIHDLVADVIRCFHEVDERMACVAQWVLVELLQTKLCGDFTYRLLFGGEEAKLILSLS